MCPPMIAHWRNLANTIELVLPSAYPSPQRKRQIDRFDILVVDWSGPKDAQVQSYLPGGANLPDDNLP